MEQVLYSLPNGWEWQVLADVVVKTENLNPLKHADQLWTYIDISSVDRDRFAVTDPKEILGKDAPSRAKKHVQLNDVIFATTRPNLKNIALVRDEYSSPVASTGFCVLRANKKVLPAYLFYFVTTDFVQAQIEPYVGGASYPAITDGNLKKAPIPIPSIEEQKRIIEKLDALLTRIDTAIEHLQENVALADALYASALDKEFSKLMKESDILPFKKLVDNQDGRRIPIKAGERKNTHGTYPYYGATGVIDYVDDFIFEGERLLISEDGANLVARKYPIAFIANGKYWVNNHAHVVNALPELTSNLYLKKFFAWVDLSSYITGSAQPKLSQGKLNTIPVPVPPLSEQTGIVAELDKAYQLTENLKKGVGEKLGMLTSLKASILDSAFKGEL